MPPLIGRTSIGSREPVHVAAAAAPQVLLALASNASASSSNPGATTTSVNTSFVCSTISAVTGRLVAMIPP